MTGDLLSWLGQLVLLAMYAAAGAFFATRHWKRKPLQAPPAEAPAPRHELREPSEELFERCRRAEEAANTLQRSIIEIPEIAQRLFGAENLRQVAEIALDLAEEMFAPTYSVFYRLQRGDYVAVARRGECEFELGHRVKKGEGVVGWTALRQLPFTHQDAAEENRTVRERQLSVAMPRDGFAICLPIVFGELTSGVILVGPTLRALDNSKAFGRTISLLVSVAITNLRVLQREQHLAVTDGLTGLLNKRAILEYLSSSLRESSTRFVSVFLFDIDHFKIYNDTNGHLAGDDLLQGMGALIREHSRDGEGLGRYGGEEFVLVMRGVSKPAALAASERLRELVEQAHLPFRENQPGGKLTISGGVASWPNDGADAVSLLRAADEALYEAKRAGRNRVVAYHAAGFDGLDANPDEASLEKPERGS